MSLAVGIQMDPIETINIDGDSTFALALEAQQRGHSLFYYLPRALTFREGKVSARGWPLEVRREKGRHFTLGEARRYPPDLAAFRKFFHHCLDNGVYFAPSQFETGFISMAHSKEDLEQTAEVAAAALAACASPAPVTSTSLISADAATSLAVGERVTQETSTQAASPGNDPVINMALRHADGRRLGFQQANHTPYDVFVQSAGGALAQVMGLPGEEAPVRAARHAALDARAGRVPHFRRAIAALHRNDSRRR